jgi:hypothetical protein
MPGYGDVQFLSQEALKIIGRLVEMPFPSNDKKIDLILGVRYDHEEGDPNWMLSEVAAGGSKPIWSHPTRDLSLICNMISTHGGNEQVEDVLPSAALMGGRGDMASASTAGTVNAVGASQAAQGIVFEPPRHGAKATLEGDLKNLFCNRSTWQK